MKTLHTLLRVVASLLFLVFAHSFSNAQCTAPLSGFDMVEVDYCVGLPVVVENKSNTRGVNCNFIWDWGDGTTETDADFVRYKTHVYKFPTTEVCNTPDGGKEAEIKLTVVPKDPTCLLTHKTLKSIRIYFPPLPDFTIPAGICLDNPEVSPFNLTCPTQSDSSTKIVWRVIDLATGKDVMTSLEKLPKFIFSSPGSYKVTLSVTNKCGTATKDQPISVYAKPVADADQITNSGTTTVCAPYQIVVSNKSVGSTGQKWSISPATGWRFINGTDETTPSAKIEFTDNGEYTLGLIVNSLCGDRAWQNNQKIIVKSKPKVDMDTLIGSCIPFTFTPVGRVPNDGGLPLQYKWTISGGSVLTASTLDPGSMTFPTAGTYPFKFMATNTCGSDEVTKYLTVKDKIDVVFANNPKTICNTSSAVKLIATPSGGAWSGTGVQADGTFDPSVAGVGTFKLTYTATFGACSDTKQTQIQVFGTSVTVGPKQQACGNDATPIALSGGTPAGGLWAGVGVTNANGTFNPSVSGAGTFNLTYTYKDPTTGCSNKADKDVVVFQPPKAAIDPLPPFCVNTEKQFVHSSLGAIGFRWYFGDGDSTTTELPLHRYFTEGVKNVRLIVVNEENCFDTAKATINIYAPVVAAFVQGLKQGCTPLSVFLTNKSTGNNGSYSWDLGNGRVLTNPDPGTVVFTNLSDQDTIYKIKLTASTPGCPSSVDTGQVTVFRGVKANFAVDIGAACSPMTVRFSNVTTGSARSYFWDFGNGNYSNDEVPKPQLFSTDTIDRKYKIQLIATNACGNDTTTRSVIVTPSKFRAFFGIDKTSGCSPLTVSLSGAATRGSKVTYDLGDGNVSNNVDLTHTFTKSGIYKIRQMATGSCGSDTMTRTVNVWETPSVSFVHSQFNICRDRRVEFLQSTSPNVSVWWDFGDGIQSGEHDPTHDYKRSGQFNVKIDVEDVSHGCKNADSVIIDVRSPIKFRVDSVKHSACFGINTGGVVVNKGDVTGGLPFYEFSLNDSTFQDPSRSGIFSNLKGRERYTVWVRDQAGCKDSVGVYVKGFPTLGLDAGRDREIDLGDSTQTFVTTNAYKLLALKWTPSNTVDCDSCESVWLQPTETTQYTVRGTGPDGCSEIAKVQVRVSSNRRIFVPNVFTPNNDGVNDQFFPHAGKNIKRVSYLRVFDRWGELVWENRDFQPDQQYSGWDGKYRGEILAPGAFVWVMEVELRNGIVEVFKGDVTLVR